MPNRVEITATTNANGSYQIPTTKVNPSTHIIVASTANGGYLTNIILYGGYYYVIVWNNANASYSPIANTSVDVDLWVMHK